MLIAFLLKSAKKYQIIIKLVTNSFRQLQIQSVNLNYIYGVLPDICDGPTEHYFGYDYYFPDISPSVKLVFDDHPSIQRADFKQTGDCFMN